MSKILCCLTLAICLAATVHANNGAKKPSATYAFYQNALSNLRTARWMIAHHPVNWQPTVSEGEAMSHIDAAIAAIKKAAVKEGRPVRDAARPVQRKVIPTRLSVAMSCLKKARTNICREGGKGLVQGLQLNAYQQIDDAIKAIRRTLNA